MKRTSKLWDKLPVETVLCPSLEIFSFLLDTTLSNWIWSHCNPALSRRLGWKYPEVPLNPNSTVMLWYLWVRKQGSLCPHPSQWHRRSCDTGTVMLWIYYWQAVLYTGHQSSGLIISCRNIWLPILCWAAILCFPLIHFHCSVYCSRASHCHSIWNHLAVHEQYSESFIDTSIQYN